MRVSLIVALDRNGLIGDERGLPWRLPLDLRRFREITMGKPVIMGRTTHEHIGRPLPGRQNVVLTRNPARDYAGCTVASSLENALAAAGSDVEEAVVIGGAEVYRSALAKVDRIYLTIVDGVFAGTTTFPCEMVRPGEWTATRRVVFEADEKNPFRHVFLVLDRRNPVAPVGLPFDLSATLASPFYDSDGQPPSKRTAAK